MIIFDYFHCVLLSYLLLKYIHFFVLFLNWKIIRQIDMSFLSCFCQIVKDDLFIVVVLLQLLFSLISRNIDHNSKKKSDDNLFSSHSFFFFTLKFLHADNE